MGGAQSAATTAAGGSEDLSASHPHQRWSTLRQADRPCRPVRRARPQPGPSLTSSELAYRSYSLEPRVASAVREANLAEIGRQLAYKSHWNGVELVAASRWFPSSKLPNRERAGLFSADGRPRSVALLAVSGSGSGRRVCVALVVCRGFGWVVEGGATSADFGDDLFGGSVPDEGFGVLVPVGGPGFDGADELVHAGEAVAA